ncbi:MAG: DsbA family oxidoreductase [Rhodocyclaceae bacterium]|nr:DsbA family oxidoreductase [Rhodocyclaceae bacterium]
MKSGLVIEVFFDLICPWCLIGKQHLGTALARFRHLHPEVPAVVRWRSFPLLPDTPEAGLPFQAFYLKRLGSEAAVAARRAEVRAAGRQAGLEFEFERIQVLPNTLAAHGLVAHAGDQGETLVERLIERLFQAYFNEGKDLGDRHILSLIAGRVGVREPPCPTEPAAPVPSVSGWLAAGHRHGIRSVPSFVINGHRALSGALPPEALLAAMRAAAFG